MLVLILGLLVLAMVTSIIIACKATPRRGYDEFDVKSFFHGFAWFFGVLAMIVTLAICITVPIVATASTIDDKIVMYQEENATIEKNIDRIVEEYLKYEHDTFTGLKTEESSITLVTLFPELKSDSLVQKQLEIYVANNAKIKSLREEKIDIAKLRWIIYFGK